MGSQADFSWKEYLEVFGPASVSSAAAKLQKVGWGQARSVFKDPCNGDTISLGLLLQLWAAPVVRSTFLTSRWDFPLCHVCPLPLALSCTPLMGAWLQFP